VSTDKFARTQTDYADVQIYIFKNSLKNGCKIVLSQPLKSTISNPAHS